MELLHLEERIRIFTTRYRLIEVLNRHARGDRRSRDGFRARPRSPWTIVRADTDGLLAFWIEDKWARDRFERAAPLLDLFRRGQRSKACDRERSGTHRLSPPTGRLTGHFFGRRPGPGTGESSARSCS